MASGGIEVNAVARRQYGDFIFDLDRQSAVHHEEHLFDFVANRFGAHARRFVNDHAVQHIAGKTGRQPFVLQPVTANCIDRALVVPGMRPAAGLRQEGCDRRT